MRPSKLANLPVIHTSLAWQITIRVRDKTTGAVPEGFDTWTIRAGIFAAAADPTPLAVCSVVKDDTAGLVTLSLSDPSALTGSPLLLVPFQVAGAETHLLAYGQVTVETTGATWEALA